MKVCLLKRKCLMERRKKFHRRLHSRAGKVLKFLMVKSTLTAIHDKLPEGCEAVCEVITGLIHRLCIEVDQKELTLMYTCLFEEIRSCIKDGCLLHLKRLKDFLTFALQNSKQSKALEKVNLLELVEFLVSKYVLSGSRTGEVLSSEVFGSLLDLRLCVLDVPLISADLTRISPIYAPVFELNNSRWWRGRPRTALWGANRAPTSSRCSSRTTPPTVWCVPSGVFLDSLRSSIE